MFRMIVLSLAAWLVGGCVAAGGDVDVLGAELGLAGKLLLKGGAGDASSVHKISVADAAVSGEMNGVVAYLQSGGVLTGVSTPDLLRLGSGATMLDADCELTPFGLSRCDGVLSDGASHQGVTVFRYDSSRTGVVLDAGDNVIDRFGYSGLGTTVSTIDFTTGSGDGTLPLGDTTVRGLRIADHYVAAGSNGDLSIRLDGTCSAGNGAKCAGTANIYAAEGPTSLDFNLTLSL